MKCEDRKKGKGKEEGMKRGGKGGKKKDTGKLCTKEEEGERIGRKERKNRKRK